MSGYRILLARHVHVRAIFVVLGVLLLALAVAAPLSAQPLSWPPPDVDEALCAQYGLSLDRLMSVSEGFPNGYWKPYEAVTRAQFAKFAVLAFGVTPIYPAAPAFPDVTQGHALYPYVEAAAAAGMIKGKGDGYFHPDAPITREEGAAVVMRYLVTLHGKAMDRVIDEAAIAYHLDLYADGGDVSDALRPEVALASARAALGGSKAGEEWYLNPQAPITRIQAAALALRHLKPGAFRNQTGDPLLDEKEASAITESLASSLLKTAAQGMVKGFATKAGGSLWDAISGKKSFPDIQADLDKANSAIADIQNTLADIQKELAALAAQYQAVSAKIEAMIAGAIAQSAINAIRAAYDDPGIVNNYYYFTHLTAVPPDPDATKAALNAFLHARIEPTDMPKYLNDIYSAILPTGAKVGVLDEWVVAVCTGALSDQELWDAYTSMEYYFCQLISYQLKCGHLIMEADNYVDPTGTQAALFLTGNWFPKLQAECDNFLGNIARFCLMNGAYKDMGDLMGSDTLHEIMARATFVYSQLLQQVKDQAGADPQGAYGLKAVLVYPTGAYAPKQGAGPDDYSLQACPDTQSPAWWDYVKNDQDHTVATEAGPTVLVWDTTDPSRYKLNTGSQYAIRVVTLPVPDYSKGHADPWIVMEGVYEQKTATRYGKATLHWYDDGYRPVDPGTAGAVRYGAAVINYSYCAGPSAGGAWSTPATLGGAGPVWARTVVRQDQFAVDNSYPGQGLFQMDWSPDAYVRGYEPNHGWNMRWLLPSFTYVGTQPISMQVTNLGQVDGYQTATGGKGRTVDCYQRMYSMVNDQTAGSDQYQTVSASGSWDNLRISAATLPTLTAKLQPSHTYAIGVATDDLYHNKWTTYGPYDFRWAGQIKYQWTGTTAFYGGAAQ